MLKTEDFNSLSQAHTGDRLQHIILDFPLVAKVTTGAPVGGITLSCDDLTLAVVTAQSDIGFLYFYDVRAFAGQVGFLLTISSSPDMCVMIYHKFIFLFPNRKHMFRALQRTISMRPKTHV